MLHNLNKFKYFLTTKSNLVNLSQSFCHANRYLLPNSSVCSVRKKTFGIGRGYKTSSPRLAIFNVQDEEDFAEKVMKSNIPVVVDFHASWCGPCKLLGPRLENVIGSKGEKVHLAKIDIDSVSDLALEYGVSAVPSVLAIKNGEVVDRFVGLQEETRIDAFVNKLTGE